MALGNPSQGTSFMDELRLQDFIESSKGLSQLRDPGSPLSSARYTESLALRTASPGVTKVGKRSIAALNFSLVPRLAQSN